MPARWYCRQAASKLPTAKPADASSMTSSNRSIVFGGTPPASRVDRDKRRFARHVDLVQFMTHNVVMKRANIHDAKTNLSRYLAELAPGDSLVLCNRNQPVAEIRSLRAKTVRKPRIGVARGRFEVPDSFFEPLPADILDGFNGG